MNHYEILNVKRNASSEEIEEAYRAAIAACHSDSSAQYGLLSEQERQYMLKRIEDAFQTLKNPIKRKKYDEKIFPSKPRHEENAIFRTSTMKLLIEDAESKRSALKKMRNIFRFGSRKRKKKAA